MITLDEAIEQERKKTEMYRCEYECEIDYYGKAFIDDHTDEFDCIKNMREHEQYAEWLEELKAYRQYIDLTEIPEQYKLGFQDGIIVGNNKAIDDFVACTKEHEYKYGNADITNIVIGFNEFIAEQLKESNVK